MVSSIEGLLFSYNSIITKKPLVGQTDGSKFFIFMKILNAFCLEFIIVFYIEKNAPRVTLIGEGTPGITTRINPL